jgi:hypothetical protein
MFHLCERCEAVHIEIAQSPPRCYVPQQEAPVPSSRNQNPDRRGFDWLAIVRTLLIQVLVLVALSGAVIRYVNWSSDEAFSEFLAASQSSVPAAKPRPQSATPVYAITGKASRGWRI